MGTVLAALLDGQQELRAELQDIKSTLADTASVSMTSPTGPQYEAVVNGVIDGRLLEDFGLEVVSDTRRGITEQEDLALHVPPKPAVQWDARFTVKLVPGWTGPSSPVSSNFLIYGSPVYGRPPLPSAPRQLTPSKAVPSSEFFAILEFTSRGEWDDTWAVPGGSKKHESLLTRLNLRLAKFIARTRSHVAFPPGVSDAAILCDRVALVGVVGQYPCTAGVVSKLTKADKYGCPHLETLFRAGRFVFIHVAFLVTASSVVTASAGGGAAGP